MSGQEVRQRRRIVPEVARQFIEPVAWTGDAAAPGELARAHELARQALALRLDARFADAVDAYDRALALFRASADTAPHDLARLLFDRAACLHRMRQPHLFPAALAGYAEALALFRQQGDRLAVADCLLNSAACYDDWDTAQPLLRATHDVRELARRYYADALARYEQAGEPVDVAWCLILRGNFLGKYAREAGQPPLRDDAIADLTRALDLLPETEPMARAQALVHLANCLNAADQFDEAVRLELLACELLRGCGEAAIDRLRSAVNPLAVWHRDRQQPDQAWPYCVEAAALSERLAQQAGHREQVLERRAQVLSSYQLAVRIALLRNDLASAYDYAQRAKGRTLFDLLNREAEQPVTAGGARAFGLRELPSLADIGRALHPGEALLDVHTLDKQGSLIVFLILSGAETIAWHREITSAAIGNALSAWRAANDRYLTAFDRYRAALAAPDSALRATARVSLDRCAVLDERPALDALGRELIDPVLPLLAERGVTTLILSPSAPLHQLPLAALRVGLDGKERGYLIDRFALSLTPSAAALALARRVRQPERAAWSPALVAAAPFCGANSPGAPASMAIHALTARDLAPRDRAGGAPAGSSGLVPLNRSGDEIRQVAAIIQTIDPAASPRLFFREQATRSAVVAEMRRAHLIHLSTHGGKIDLQQSIDDYTLFLAPESDAQAPTMLTAQEVFDGEIPLDGVFSIVLSACHLGDAATKGAEALGFAQAFLAAGAGVILAPIWAVADLPTALLMIDWYRQLVADGRPDVAHAWQSAVRRLRDAPELGNLFAHPHFWAGFLPTGDGALRLGSA